MILLDQTVGHLRCISKTISTTLDCDFTEFQSTTCTLTAEYEGWVGLTEDDISFWTGFISIYSDSSLNYHWWTYDTKEIYNNLIALNRIIREKDLIKLGLKKEENRY